MHTLTISDLDDFEAEHIGYILKEYEVKMFEQKLEAMIEDHKAGGGHRAEWYVEHIAWHESIMSKVKWTKESK